MTNLTKAETELMISFANCEMNTTNGAPEYAECASDLCTYVWLDQRRVEGMNTQQKKGVLGSLVKKGLLNVVEDNPDDLLGFTSEGFAVVKGLISK